MTLSVYDITNDYVPYNIKEANVCRSGGNDFQWRDIDYRKFELQITNDQCSIEITHKTAELLLGALTTLSSSKNAEYYMYLCIKENFDSLTYKKLWTKLGQDF